MEIDGHKAEDCRIYFLDEAPQPFEGESHLSCFLSQALFRQPRELVDAPLRLLARLRLGDRSPSLRLLHPFRSSFFLSTLLSSVPLWKMEGKPRLQTTKASLREAVEGERAAQRLNEAASKASEATAHALMLTKLR